MQIGQYIEYAGTAAERVAAQTLADMVERLGRGFGARWIETDTRDVYLYTPAGWIVEPGIVISGLELPAGGATEAKQDTQITAEQAIQASVGATTAAPVDEAEGATARTGISLWKGTKNYLRTLLSRWPAALGQGTSAQSLPVVLPSDAADVKVTMDGESVAVSGPLTDTQLRATAVPVSGPLTDTALRATAVPVSGPVTDTQLRATAVSVAEKQQTITRISGTKAAAGDNVIVAAPAAGNRLVVSYLKVQLEVDVSTTMIWKAGAAEAYRHRALSDGSGDVKDFQPGREWQLPAATALNLNLSGANSCGYSVEYRTEAI